MLARSFDRASKSTIDASVGAQEFVAAICDGSVANRDFRIKLTLLRRRLPHHTITAANHARAWLTGLDRLWSRPVN